MLHLVRHGRPLIDPRRPASTWDLDPAAYDEVWALRTSGRLPARAAWFSSPEPKAVATAALLTDGEVAVIDGLREHARGDTWVDDLPAAVGRAFTEPTVPALVGWEPLDRCRERVVTVVEGIVAAHPADEIVLVGHGTAWTVLVAALTDHPPDLAVWRALSMPDVIAVEPPRTGQPHPTLGSQRTGIA